MKPHINRAFSPFIQKEKALTGAQAGALEMASGHGRLSGRIRYEKKEPQARAYAYADQQRRAWAKLVSSVRPVPRARC